MSSAFRRRRPRAHAAGTSAGASGVLSLPWRGRCHRAGAALAQRGACGGADNAAASRVACRRLRPQSTAQPRRVLSAPPQASAPPRARAAAGGRARQLRQERGDVCRRDLRRGRPGALDRAGGPRALLLPPPRTPARQRGVEARPQRCAAPPAGDGRRHGASRGFTPAAALFRHATAGSLWPRAWCRTKKWMGAAVRCPAQQKIRSFPRSHAHLATPSQTLGSASVTPLRAKFAARCVRIAAAKRAQRPVRAVRPCRSLSLGARLAPPAAWQLRGYAAPAWLPRQQFSARLRAARTFPPPPE